MVEALELSPPGRQRDEFHSTPRGLSEGAELRLRHDYELAGGTSTFAGGLYFYHALQDRTDERGATPDADSGELRNFNTGETWDVALFAENRFEFGRFSLTPGMRLEHIWQSLDESVNVAKVDAGDPLASRSDFSFVPLLESVSAMSWCPLRSK